VTWTKTLSGAGQLRAFAAQQTADGGYIVGADGPPAGTDRWDVNLMKIDVQGNLAWQSDVSGADFPQHVAGHAVVQTSDGGYAVYGTTLLSDSGVILFKTDGLGRRQWFKRYPIVILEGTYDRGSLRLTSDGGYIIGTRTLLKVDSQGNQQWLKTFDDVVCANSVLQTPDGG
jgi:CubicO group peptidase (beta-lactamase class C family)